MMHDIDGLVKDIFIANELDILQSCAKPYISSIISNLQHIWNSLIGELFEEFKDIDMYFTQAWKFSFFNGFQLFCMWQNTWNLE